LRVTVIGNVALDLNTISSRVLKQEGLVEIAKTLFHHDGDITLEHKLGNYYIYILIHIRKKIIL
jgi:N-methylhydantoinase A